MPEEQAGDETSENRVATPGPTLERRQLIAGFRNVRYALGVLGFALPLTLTVYGVLPWTKFETSISHFYHSPLGDFLVGALWAIGVFLIAYKNYQPQQFDAPAAAILDRHSGDRRIAIAAGISAIGVAMFPVVPDGGCESSIGCGIRGLTHYGEFPFTSALHFGFATTFFVCIMVFCFVVFPATPGPVEEMVRTRRTRGSRGDGLITIRREPNARGGTTLVISVSRQRLYIWCGRVIALSLACLVGYMLLETFAYEAWLEALDRVRWFFAWEAIAVVAFATAWLAKGTEYRTKPLVREGYLGDPRS